MAVKSSQFNVTDVDFDDISRNLKSYLQGQSQFKDYDFEGSTLSVLIDLMSYATHISAVNTNIAASEMFLDSAQLRKNVVSRAKDLGYVPQSESAAKAQINLQLRNVRDSSSNIPTENEMALQVGSIFQTVYDGATFNFVVTSSAKPVQNKTTFDYSNVKVVQGNWVSDTFVFDNQIKNQRFSLSNERVDKLEMSVSVTSLGSTITYANASTASRITTTSKVYYLQENEDGYIEIYFGDNFLGQGLLDGDTITVNYIAVDKIHANGARIFSLISSVNGYSDSLVATVAPAQGGDEKESIDSIKFKASKFYTSQNRLVTLNDYKAKITEYYPNADAVAIWGGEDNDPPEYGKVFVAIKPKNSDYLTDLEKDEVVRQINKLNMLTVRPVIISPDIVKILLSCTFKYNEKDTTFSVGQLETLVASQINVFDNEQLSNFDSIFRHSKLVSFIDQTDPAILSNITNIRLSKKFKPSLYQTKGYEVAYGNPLYHPESGHNAVGGGILSSTGFMVSMDNINKQYFDEDGLGNLRRFIFSGSTRVYQDREAGTVNYATGKITINAINFTEVDLVDGAIEFIIIPASQDVVAVRGNLIDIDTENVKVTGEIDTISSGESSAGVGYSSTTNTNY